MYCLRHRFGRLHLERDHWRQWSRPGSFVNVPSAVGLDAAHGVLHAPSWGSQAAAAADPGTDVVGAKRPDRAEGA